MVWNLPITNLALELPLPLTPLFVPLFDFFLAASPLLHVSFIPNPHHPPHKLQPYYAIKCNPEPIMLRLLMALGAGFDCASKVELATVLSIGEPDKGMWLTR